LQGGGLLGPYSRTIPRALWCPWGRAVSYERGNPVEFRVGEACLHGAVKDLARLLDAPPRTLGVRVRRPQKQVPLTTPRS